VECAGARKEPGARRDDNEHCRALRSYGGGACDAAAVAVGPKMHDDYLAESVGKAPIRNAI